MFPWMVLLVSVVFPISTKADVQPDRKFPTNRNGDKFTNMVINSTNTIYVAENGFVHILDASLNPVKNFSTCVGDGCTNINKVISVFGDQLVLCGTGNNGMCQVWNGNQFIYNSSTTIGVFNYLVVSSDIDRPAVGLVHEEDLFLGVTFGPGINTIGKRYEYLLSRRGIKEFFTPFGVVDLKYNINENYIVYFKKVFEHEGFIYLLTNQKTKIGSEGYVSKLVRMCLNETSKDRATLKSIKSYTDIPMSCKVDGADYNLLQDAELLPGKGILVAAFAKGDDPENPQPGSAICVYTIDTVTAEILNAKEDFITCNATDYIDRESAYLDIDLPQCVPMSTYQVIKDDDYICPKEGRGTKVIGTNTVKPTTAYKIKDTGVSIKTVKGVERYSLYSDVFLGTDKGSINKITLLDDLTVFEYENSCVIDNGHPILGIDEIGNYAYVLTNRKVFRVKNTECSTFTSCKKTMAAKNPSCGWCVGENRCTKRDACSNTWLSSLSECVSIVASPKYVAAYSRGNVDININITNLPSNFTISSLKCRYLDGSQQIGWSMSLKGSNGVFKCKDVGFGEHKLLRLHLAYSYSPRIFSLAETTIHVYRCKNYKKCGMCTISTEVNCEWCLSTAKCQNAGTGCNGQVTVTKGNGSGCPMLLGNTDIFIPDGISEIIELRTENLVPDYTYKCVVENQTEEFTATVNANGNTLKCFLQITYEDDRSKKQLQISISQKGASGFVELDEDQRSYVTVYKCQYLATDCTMCNALKPSRYTCNWCQDGHCGHITKCSNTVTCPPPRITRIHPSIGGYKGGTVITLSGTDFGTRQSGVRVEIVPTFVSAAHYRCYCGSVEITQSDDSGYHPINKEIRCHLGILFLAEDMFVGLVNLTYFYEELQSDPVSFRLVKPIVTHIKPEFGPISGGTEITMSGTDLMMGNALNSVILGTIPQRHITLNANRIIFTTTRVSRPISISKFILKFDGVIYGSDVSYEYVNNPVIEKISSQKTILSGGTNITLTGQHLKSARDTKITIRYAGSEQSRNCSQISPEKTKCPMPGAPEVLRQEMEENLNASDGYPTAESGSISADALINYDGYVKEFTVKYFRDPLIYAIKGYNFSLHVNKRNTKLTINGQYMNLAADINDYTVYVGQSGKCDKLHLTINHLICYLPLPSPEPEKEKLNVIVSLGNIKYSIGYVKYKEPSKDESTDNVILSVGVSVSIVLALLIVIGTVVFCIKYRRIKARTPTIRKTEHKQSQLDDTKGSPDRNTSFPSNRTGDRVTGQSNYMELDHRRYPGQNYESLDRNTGNDQSPNTGIEQLNTSGTVYEGLDQNGDRGRHIYLGLDKTQ